MNDFTTICELFYFIKETHEKMNLLNYRENNRWKSLSTEDFSEKVESLAQALMDLGVKKGDKIGIISNPSPFWVIADLAIILSGAVTVPIFRRISPENLKFEIDDSGMRIIFIGDSNEYESVKLYGESINKIITIGFKKEESKALSFDDLINSGRKNFKQQNIFKPAPEDLFTIIYTSGSTGVPKGVMLTHKNIISQIKSAALVYELNKNDDLAISSLPLSHIFERMVMYFYLSVGVSVCFADDLNNIGALIRDVKPSIMTVVPRLLEKIFEKMKSSADGYMDIKKHFVISAFKRAETKSVIEKYHGFMDWIFKKFVYTKLLNALGGNFRYVISGAASMPVDVGRFFLNIGVPLYEGYGMTEASPVIACNYRGSNKLGTVGKAFPGVTVKINDDGEVLAKGPNVMKGYYNNPEENKKALDKEGFLHTGDLGRLDNDGYLKITGRKKELFKKSTGEYVAPLPIEQALSRIEFADTAVIIAEAKKFVTALIFPDFEKVKKFKEKNGFKDLSDEEFLDSSFVMEMVKKYISEMNSHLHHTEEVQKFMIIKDPISIETGELTPTMKIRRNVINEKFKKEIDRMYEEHSNGGVI